MLCLIGDLDLPRILNWIYYCFFKSHWINSNWAISTWHIILNKCAWVNANTPTYFLSVEVQILRRNHHNIRSNSQLQFFHMFILNGSFHLYLILRRVERIQTSLFNNTFQSYFNVCHIHILDNQTRTYVLYRVCTYRS